MPPVVSFDGPPKPDPQEAKPRDSQEALIERSMAPQSGGGAGLLNLRHQLVKGWVFSQCRYQIRFRDEDTERRFEAHLAAGLVPRVRILFSLATLASASDLAALISDTCPSSCNWTLVGLRIALLALYFAYAAASYTPRFSRLAPRARFGVLLTGVTAAFLLYTAVRALDAYSFEEVVYDLYGPALAIGLFLFSHVPVRMSTALLPLLVPVSVASEMLGAALRSPPELRSGSILVAVGIQAVLGTTVGLIVTAAVHYELEVRRSFLLGDAAKRAKEGAFGRQRSAVAVLRNLLPEPVIEAVHCSEWERINRVHESATIVFVSAEAPSLDIRNLQELMARLEALADLHGVMKVKSMGTVFMGASGVSLDQDPDIARSRSRSPSSAFAPHHTERAAAFALEAVAAARGFALGARAGLYEGPVVSGVIGCRLAFDLFGDTCNLAQRMCYHGAEGRVQLPVTARDVILAAAAMRPPGGPPAPVFSFSEPEDRPLKGRGVVRACFVERASSESVHSTCAAVSTPPPPAEGPGPAPRPPDPPREAPPPAPGSGASLLELQRLRRSSSLETSQTGPHTSGLAGLASGIAYHPASLEATSSASLEADGGASEAGSHSSRRLLPSEPAYLPSPSLVSRIHAPPSFSQHAADTHRSRSQRSTVALRVTAPALNVVHPTPGDRDAEGHAGAEGDAEVEALAARATVKSHASIRSLGSARAPPRSLLHVNPWYPGEFVALARRADGVGPLPPSSARSEVDSRFSVGSAGSAQSQPQGRQPPSAIFNFRRSVAWSRPDSSTARPPRRRRWWRIRFPDPQLEAEYTERASTSSSRFGKLVVTLCWVVAFNVIFPVGKQLTNRGGSGDLGVRYGMRSIALALTLSGAALHYLLQRGAAGARWNPQLLRTVATHLFVSGAALAPVGTYALDAIGFFARVSPSAQRMTDADATFGLVVVASTSFFGFWQMQYWLLAIVASSLATSFDPARTWDFVPLWLALFSAAVSATAYLRETESRRGFTLQLETLHEASVAERAEGETRALLDLCLPHSVLRSLSSQVPFSGSASAFEFEAAKRPTEFECVAVLQSDIVGFSALSSRTEPHRLVNALNSLFAACDEIAERYGLQTLRTAGDAWIGVVGLEKPAGQPEVAALLQAADEILALYGRTSVLARAEGWTAGPNSIASSNGRYTSVKIEARLGAGMGRATGAVVGTKRWTWELLGPAVADAGEMEHGGVPGRVHVTRAVAECAAGAGFAFEPRGGPGAGSALLSGLPARGAPPGGRASPLLSLEDA